MAVSTRKSPAREAPKKAARKAPKKGSSKKGSSKRASGSVGKKRAKKSVARKVGIVAANAKVLRGPNGEKTVPSGGVAFVQQASDFVQELAHGVAQMAAAQGRKQATFERDGEYTAFGRAFVTAAISCKYGNNFKIVSRKDTRPVITLAKAKSMCCPLSCSGAMGKVIQQFVAHVAHEMMKERAAHTHA